MLVRLYHGAEVADFAQAEFVKVFQKHDLPEDIPEIAITDKSRIWLPKLLVQLNLASSNGEAKRNIQQGAVKIDNQKVTDPDLEIEPATGMVLQVGRRRFAKIL
jgi:tyrosyl-tRNA synthetase